MTRQQQSKITRTKQSSSLSNVHNHTDRQTYTQQSLLPNPFLVFFVFGWPTFSITPSFFLSFRFRCTNVGRTAICSRIGNTANARMDSLFSFDWHFAAWELCNRIETVWGSAFWSTISTIFEHMDSIFAKCVRLAYFLCDSSFSTFFFLCNILLSTTVFHFIV